MDTLEPQWPPTHMQTHTDTQGRKGRASLITASLTPPLLFLSIASTVTEIESAEAPGLPEADPV